MLDGEIQASTAVRVLRAAGIRVDVNGDAVSVYGGSDVDPPEVYVWKPGTILGSKTIERLTRRYGIAKADFLDAERKAS